MKKLFVILLVVGSLGIAHAQSVESWSFGQSGQDEQACQDEQARYQAAVNHARILMESVIALQAQVGMLTKEVKALEAQKKAQEKPPEDKK
jgi:hypothetical protein